MPSASVRAGAWPARGGLMPRILGGSAWVLAGRLMFGVSVVLQNIVLARLLGPQSLGAFLLAQSIVLPLSLVAVFGLDLLAMRDLRDPRDAANRIAPTSFLRIAAGLITLVTVLVSILAITVLQAACGASTGALDCGFAATFSPVLGPLVLLSALQLLLTGYLRALGRIAEAAFLAGVLSTVALLIMTSLAFAMHVPLTIHSILLLQLLALAQGVGASLLAAARIERVGDGARAGWPVLARVGPSLMLTQVLALLVSQSDVWVLGSAASAASLAQYGVATRLAQLVSLPHLVLNGVLPPVMAAFLAEGRGADLQATIQASVAAAVVPAAGLFLVFLLFGRMVLTTAFGPFYGAVAATLAILALGNLVNVACGPCSQLLIMSGRQMLLNRITGANCLACFATGLVAAHWLGAIGVAAVYACGLSLQGVIGAYAAAKLVRIRTHAGPGDLLRAIRSTRAAGPVGKWRGSRGTH